MRAIHIRPVPNFGHAPFSDFPVRILRVCIFKGPFESHLLYFCPSSKHMKCVANSHFKIVDAPKTNHCFLLNHLRIDLGSAITQEAIEAQQTTKIKTPDYPFILFLTFYLFRSRCSQQQKHHQLPFHPKEAI